MKRLEPFSILLALTGLAACATASPEPHARAVAEQAMTEVMRLAPSEELVALPVLQPASRVESQIKTFSTEELARWILPPQEAGQVARAELIPQARLPRLGGVWLFQQPQATAHPGVCQVRGWEVLFRMPDESSLTYQQHLDPPQQPYSYRQGVRWKVIGSTGPDARTSPPDCAAALPYAEWFEAPSAAALHRAANHVEQAQLRPGSVRLVCSQWRYDEAKKDTVYPPCPNPRALLEKLTPNLIKRVRPADCTIEPQAGESGCIAIEYHDPAGPRTHSFYAVTLPNGPRPRYVQIAQGMMPPH